MSPRRKKSSLPRDANPFPRELTISCLEGWMKTSRSCLPSTARTLGPVRTPAECCVQGRPQIRSQVVKPLSALKTTVRRGGGWRKPRGPQLPQPPGQGGQGSAAHRWQSVRLGCAGLGATCSHGKPSSCQQVSEGPQAEVKSAQNHLF